MPITGRRLDFLLVDCTSPYAQDIFELTYLEFEAGDVVGELLALVSLTPMCVVCTCHRT